MYVHCAYGRGRTRPRLRGIIVRALYPDMGADAGAGARRRVLPNKGEKPTSATSPRRSRGGSRRGLILWTSLNHNNLGVIITFNVYSCMKSPQITWF